MEDKVHIWQLPEKNNTIDKSSDIMMVHDGISLKKVILNKLYEYLNQDYKIDDMVQEFEDELNKITSEYDPKYKECETFLLQYEQIVKELKEKFKTNEDNIRDLKKGQAKLELDISDIDTNYTSISNKLDILSDTLSNFKKKLNELKNQSKEDTVSIRVLNKSVNNLSDTASQLYINSGSMKDKMSNIKKNQEKDLSEREDKFIKKMENEYDKILAIVDYYHHIHDKEYK